MIHRAAFWRTAFLARLLVAQPTVAEPAIWKDMGRPLKYSRQVYVNVTKNPVHLTLFPADASQR